MSLIGPCPERPELAEVITKDFPDFSRRLEVKPGIISLAEVRFGNTTSVKDAVGKLKYDLLYIKNMCWFLDFKIMFWAIGISLSGERIR